MKILNIVNGWKNLLTDDEVSFNLAKERAIHCQQCPGNKHSKYAEFIPERGIVEINGSICSLCKCPLSAKLRSIKENCPLKKW